jgi:hypothetical protein
MAIETIAEMLERFGDYPGAVSINNPKASVYHIARYMLNEFRERDLLPCTVEQAIDQTFKEGWFIRTFYYEAIANLVYVGAIQFDGQELKKGVQYDQWLDYVDAYLEAVARSREYDQRQASMWEEGRRRAIKELILEALWDSLGSYPSEGVLINRSNFRKRVQPGAKCYVELGKRHFSFDSEHTKRRETVSANYYVLGEIVSIGPKTFRVRVKGVELDLDHYRATKVVG